MKRPGLSRGGRELSALAVPLVLTQLAQVALTTTDTVMMGLLGVDALAAGGLAIVIFNQLRTMGVGLLTATGNQIASATARAERDAELSASAPGADDVRRIVRAGFLVATVAGVLGAAIMVGIGQLLGLLGQNAGVATMTRQLLLTLAPGLVPCLWVQVVRQLTVGMRRPQGLLRITLASVAVNAALDYAFIHGTWVVPKLGLDGIGLATTLVYLGTFGALLASARRDPVLAAMLPSFARTSPQSRPDTRADVMRILRSGTPIALTYASEAGFFFATALVAGSFGPAALAAHTAVNQLVYIVFQIAVGLSHASSILVSRETELHGRAEGMAVRNLALRSAGLVMGVVGIVYVAVPHVVLAPFLDGGGSQGQDARDIAVHLLYVAAVLQFFDCAQNIGIGLLRGLGNTTVSFKLTLVGYWLVGLPAVLLFAWPLGLDVVGVWLGLLAGLAVTSALLLREFTRSITLPGAPVRA